MPFLKIKIYLLILLIFNKPAFSGAIFCPEKISCVRTNNELNCRYASASINHWNKITGNGRLTGTYINTYVSAPFYSHDQGVVICVYSHEHSRETLILTSKAEASLERATTFHQSWRQEESWWECAPRQEGDCPLGKQSALIIKNLSHELLKLSHGDLLYPHQFSRIYENDLPGDLIEIYQDDKYLGRIMVDLNQNLKITNIQSHADMDYDLTRMENFNAVAIVKRMPP